MARARLHKVMADAGVASRRASEELIRAGRVSVDGRIAILGELVDPYSERILVDGKPLPSVDAPRSYWVLNKPAGVVSTVRDRHADRTVMDFLPVEARAASRLYPVGRLDESSEGLLLFTNDGPWADLLLHPRYGVEREYMVGLDRSITKAQRVALKGGIELDEGLAQLDLLEDATPAQTARLLALLDPPHARLRWYRVVLAQGWKRQIRRMFEVVGAPVRRLVRVRVGTLKLTDLLAGQARPLSHHEVAQLSARARATKGARSSAARSKAGAPG
jgi:23S rRNA pseudouridine2605 synthase